MERKTQHLPTQTRLATFEPATFDTAARTVDVTWTTGARVRRFNWWDDEAYDEELALDGDAVDMSRLASGAAPVLDSHRAHGGLAAQIGVVERAWFEGAEGRATLRLSGRPELAGLIDDIRSGIIRNISVGYSVRRYQVTREQGQVPVYRAVDWQPHELSFVTVPADASASTRSNDSTGSPCEFISATPTKDRSMTDIASAADAAPAADAVNDPAPSAPDTSATRAAEIVDLATRHGFADRAAGWIREGRSADQVRSVILDQLAVRDRDAGGHRNRVDAVEDEADKLRRAAEQVILSRAQSIDPDTRKRVTLESGNPCRSMSLLDMARAAVERTGVRASGMSKLELVGRAFTQSTSDFPVLLESAMHKTLQGAYATAPDTWSRFCSIGSVSDFRAHKRYRVGSIGNIDAINELGEFVNKAIPDGESSSITAATKGNIINLSRQAIINDDLSAFVGLSAMLGRAARRTIEADVYALLASNPTMGDGVALFHASHNNLGTGGAPSVTTIEEARTLLAKQKDISGNDFLDLRPALWLGPMATGGDVRVANDSQYDPDTANKLQRPNKVRGLFRDVIDTPRILDTKWYVFADPQDAPVIEVAFLDGQDMPFLEMEEGFSVDGSRWKVRLDYGTAAIDWRGAVRNAGA